MGPGPIARWLDTFLSNRQYAELFKRYGLDTLNDVCKLDHNQLLSMGISQPDCEKIMENVSVLRQTIQVNTNTYQPNIYQRVDTFNQIKPTVIENVAATPVTTAKSTKKSKAKSNTDKQKQVPNVTINNQMLANHDMMGGANREAAKKISNEIVQMAQTQSSKNYTCLPVAGPNGPGMYGGSGGGYMNPTPSEPSYDSYTVAGGAPQTYENGGYPRMSQPAPPPPQPYSYSYQRPQYTPYNYSRPEQPPPPPYPGSNWAPNAAPAQPPPSNYYNPPAPSVNAYAAADSSAQYINANMAARPAINPAAMNKTGNSTPLDYLERLAHLPEAAAAAAVAADPNKPSQHHQHSFHAYPSNEHPYMDPVSNSKRNFEMSDVSTMPKRQCTDSNSPGGGASFNKGGQYSNSKAAAYSSNSVSSCGSSSMLSSNDSPTSTCSSSSSSFSSTSNPAVSLPAATLQAQTAPALSTNLIDACNFEFLDYLPELTSNTIDQTITTVINSFDPSELNLMPSLANSTPGRPL